MPGRKASIVSTLAAFIAILLVFAACEDGGKNAEPTSTPTRPSTATPALTPTPLPDVRTLDLGEQPVVRDFAQQLNGEIATEEIIYADLTGDGRDDAVVTISSGGTQGDLGFVVVGYLDGKLEELLTEAPTEGEIRVAVSDGLIVESLPVYAAGDLPGFPANVKNVFYAWDGDHFVIDHEEVVANPNSPPRQ